MNWNQCQKFICVFISLLIFLTGCAGRQANPIQVYLPGDENRSCQGYMAEIAQLESDMNRILPDTNKFGYNALMFAGGCLILVPFFFMDLKDADKTEWDAMRMRRNRLAVYAAEKGCDFGSQGQPLPIPSFEEMKKIAEEQKKAAKAD